MFFGLDASGYLLFASVSANANASFQQSTATVPLRRWVLVSVGIQNRNVSFTIDGVPVNAIRRLSEVQNYRLGDTASPLDWGDWADEYWAVYPDGVAVRRSVLWMTARDREKTVFQESIVFVPPGERPEDSLNFDALVEPLPCRADSLQWPSGRCDRPRRTHVDLPHLLADLPQRRQALGKAFDDRPYRKQRGGARVYSEGLAHPGHSYGRRG